MGELEMSLLSKALPRLGTLAYLSNLMRNLIDSSVCQGKRLSKASFNTLKSVFLSRGCSICDRPTSYSFCTDCSRQILQQTSKPAPSLNQPSNGLSISALGAYSGALKRAILAMKYSDRPDVAQSLGTALAQHWQSQQSTRSEDTNNLYVLPIPLHLKRQQSRGYNQAELIARSFCRVSRLPLLAHGLVRTQATKPQHELGLAARQQNLEQVFDIGSSLDKLVKRQVRHSHRKVAVWLIDDIYTTGATAQSAVRTLEHAGIAVMGMATVARAAL